MRTVFLRSREISRLRGTLERDGFPRLQMLLLVSLTGAVGLLGSFCLLEAGMHTMWLRYLLAFSIAYMAFIGLLWLWLRTNAEDYNGLDLPSDFPLPRSGPKVEPPYIGRGGTFDGGGASGHFESVPSQSFDSVTSASFDGTVGDAGPHIAHATGEVAGKGAGEVLGSACSADEAAIPLLVVLALAAIVFSSLWVVYLAPTLFAELLVDGVLAASLYRRLRGLETRHWLQTALRRTVLPFLLTASVVTAAGAGLQHYAPHAHTLAQAWRHHHPSR